MYFHKVSEVLSATRLMVIGCSYTGIFISSYGSDDSRNQALELRNDRMNS
jgi:hypothetical protein